MFQDKTLACKDCGKNFTWTAGEQDFFAQKGFSKPPIRCADCRKKKKQQLQGNSPEKATSSDEMFEIACSKCGKKTEVNFRPRGDSEILCSSCFEEKNK